ncbi:hypothetical protein Pyn_17188 [Prunus yedoensis var. nudiflora]|uniref:Uncharacterized protein n=1 Tax=Prunus yedoensis var. nudiflora TaxID=2094558 RepID=A0A314UUK4_PRUYE|nr:hypothetical protein Pyn_17188 [Prunus yedoensis var. nudiflora]
MGTRISAIELEDTSHINNNSSIDQGKQDVYFDDESAEVVISSLRLGDDQER